MPAVTRDGVKLCWYERGEGEPLLLVMGLGADAQFWEFQIDAFAQKHRVIRFDNRGVGQSDKPPGPYTIADMAEDARAVLDGAGVRRAHVVGISMGGMIAQELVVRHPERVGALVLAATFAKADADAQAVAEEGAARSGLGASPLALLGGGVPDAALLAAVDLEQIFGFMMSLVLSPAFIERERAWLRGTFARFQSSGATIAHFLAQVGAVLQHDTTARLNQVRAPTLVLTGTDDKLVPPRHSHALQRLIPGARLVELEGGTHGFNIEMKDAFNKAVLDFLDEHPLARGA